MWVTHQNLYAKVARATEQEVQWLRSEKSGLTFRNRRAHFSGEDYAQNFYDLVDERFPAGFLPAVLQNAAASGVKVELIDGRKKPASPPIVPLGNAQATDAALRLIKDFQWLRDYQRAAVSVALEETRGIIHLPTGGGKCLGIGTIVLKHDGSCVPVEEIQPGDALMGPDSTARRVQATSRGRGPLYKIVPRKGAPWVCNDAHVLTLVHTETGAVEDISLTEYLRQTAYWKHCRKLFQPACVEFPRSPEPPLDPYFVGVWYGDGRRDLAQGVQISKPDAEIEAVCREIAAQFDLEVRVDRYKSCPTYRIVAPRGQPNPLKVLMQETLDVESLPRSYLTASSSNRAALLAGLLDTDGHLAHGYYEIVQERPGIARDIAFLARSLGLRVTERIKRVNGKPYFRLLLLGDATHLPLRIARKAPSPRRQRKNALRTGFRIEALGDGDYAGFSLDGDGRFLLGDFTVTHNTEIAIGLVRAVPCKWLFLVHRKTLMEQAAARYEERTSDTAGRIGEGRWKPGDRFTVATFQSLAHRLREEPVEAKAFLREFEGVIIDECHVLPAESFWRVAMALSRAFYRIGVSGTPLDREDQRSHFAVAATGPVIFKHATQELIDEGVLARPIISMARVRQEFDERDAEGLFQRWPWQKVYEQGIVRSKARNRVVLAAAVQAARPCLLFVKEIAHGRALHRSLEKRGVNTAFVWGSASLQARQQAVKKLVRGDYDVLISSVIFQEGMDIPELRSVVVASGGKSVIAALQRLGRGMRVVAGKTTFEVWDVADEGNAWLERHGKARRRAYQREQYEVKIIQLTPSYAPGEEPSMAPSAAGELQRDLL